MACVSPVVFVISITVALSTIVLRMKLLECVLVSRMDCKYTRVNVLGIVLHLCQPISQLSRASQAKRVKKAQEGQGKEEEGGGNRYL